MKRVVLGVLTTHPDGASCRRPRRPQWRPWVALSRAAARIGVTVYVFSPAGVDWERQRVRGFRWTSGPEGGPGRWRGGVFPLPDVVYNRVPTRIAEGRPAVRRTLQRLRTMLRGRVFNPHYLNKSGVARLLIGDPDVGAHVPATTLFRDGSRLRRFVRRHKAVYVKSVGGSLGNDVMRLAARPEGGWALHYNAGAFRTRRAVFGQWEAALHRMRELTRGRPFVVQQAIDLARADGRPFDLRLLAQKAPDGRWRFTGGAARVAGPGQITTHVPRGGRRLAMAAALEKAFGKAAAEALAAQIGSLAARTAAALDEKLGGGFVEMSLDVGVDGRGHPWIFEVNAKPLHFDEGDIQRRRNEGLLNYARAAAGGGG